MQFLSTNWNSCRVLSPYPHTKRSVSSTWGITFSRLFHLQMLVLLLLGGFSCAASTTRKKPTERQIKVGRGKTEKTFAVDYWWRFALATRPWIIKRLRNVSGFAGTHSYFHYFWIRPNVESLSQPGL